MPTIKLELTDHPQTLDQVPKYEVWEDDVGDAVWRDDMGNVLYAKPGEGTIHRLVDGGPSKIPVVRKLSDPIIVRW